VTYYSEAELEGLDVSRVPCRLAELGVGGAFVEARTNLPIGGRASIRFRLGEREIVAQVEVRYAFEGIGMGLQFTQLSDPDKQTVASFVEQQGAH
jgi:hypothetical protein